jgi:hypothetical protein
MAARMATLEEKLSTMAFDATTNEVVISGANLRIVNGLGTTNTTNGLGNLIVGYNESRSTLPNPSGRPPVIDNRTGSHNVVVGAGQNFSSFGGVVVGYYNEISESWASVSGGAGNTASGPYAAVSGGYATTASGYAAAVSGGFVNTASGDFASVSGGVGNTASGYAAAVSGGAGNTASNFDTSVSGGYYNTASGYAAAVSGGAYRTAPDTNNWAAGALLQPN